MKVKELINKLLDCKMDADVTVLVEIKKDTLKHNLEDYGNYDYPIDDDIEIKEIINYTNNAVSIVLEEIQRGIKKMKFELTSAILYYTMKYKEAEEKEQKIYSEEDAESVIREYQDELKWVQHQKEWNYQMIQWLEELKGYREGAS